MKFLRKLYSVITGTLTVKGNINIQAGSNVFIGTVDNYALSLRTNNTDRIFITNDGKVGIGTVSPLATCHVNSDIFINGALATKITTITANTTLNNTYHIILANASSGAITITLPSAPNCTGRQYIIKKIDSSTNAVIIMPQSGQTIDGQSSINLTTQNDLRRIVSSGTNWYII
jgi:hypothetical protein